MKKFLTLLVGASMLSSVALAATSILDAEFSGSVINDPTNMVVRLTGDITTDDTILIPEGYTLDGNGHTITGKDPVGGNFKGAVVGNAGTVAHVTDLFVTVDSLANVGQAGADRLRGIMFEACSGTITGCFVMGINKGASGHQEGNAIEIRNAPFDGTHPDTQVVEVSHTTVVDYQKTGIVANGDVDVTIQHNSVGASATQANLAANSIQIGFGGKGTVVHNRIDGNQWLGASDFAATAVLLFDSAPGTVVSQNIIQGNSDIAIYAGADGVVADNNKLFDNGEDGGHYDIGIGDYGTGNTITNNKIRGFDTPIDGADLGTNKAIPGGN